MRHFPRRGFVLALFASLLGFGFLVTRTEAQPDTIKQILPGVWFRQGDLEGKGHCNNVVIEMADYLIVVDANYPSGAEAVLNDIRKISRKPVRYVFDTHHHGDHAYGNPVWRKAGATTLAYAGVTEEMKRYEPKRWREDAARREDVSALNLATAEPPQKTFTRSPMVLEDRTRRVEFHHFGWAHTRGDGFVYLPKERVLCTGDAATNGPYNFTGDAHISNWPAVLSRAMKLGAVHVLPGHGPAGGAEILEGERAFMTELRAAVEKQILEGRTLEQLVTMKDGVPEATSLKLPDYVGKWVGRFHAAQVRDMYEELKAGKPHGDLPH